MGWLVASTTHTSVPPMRSPSPRRTRNGGAKPGPCGSSVTSRPRGLASRAAAATYYGRAFTLAEELGMRPLQAHCHRGLGTLYAATGQREQARTALSTAIAMYRAMEMTFWLPETEAALAQVDA